MKKLLFLALIGVMLSCSTSNKSASLLKEDELLITRKYIGDFLDYSYTGPQITGGHDLIWIRTTIYNTFGEISAFGKSCEFSAGDRIYLRPTKATPGNYGYWEYQIENDKSVNYIMSDYKYQNNVFVRSRDL